MSMIRVNPDELLHVAGTMQYSITDMDAVMSQAVDQLCAIRDRAKGLDDIRQRARQLQQMHHQHMEFGRRTQQHIAQSAQRFAEADQQLGSQLALQVASQALSAGGAIPTQIQQWFAEHSDLLKQFGIMSMVGLVPAVAPLLIAYGMSQSAAWQAIHGMIDSVSDIADLEYLAKGWGSLISGIGGLSESLLAHGKLKWIHDSVTAFVRNEQGGVSRILGHVEGVAGKVLTGLQLVNIGMSGVEFARAAVSGDRSEIVDAGGRFAGDGLIFAASSVFPPVAAIYGVSSLVQLGGGAVASGLEWLGYGEQAQTTRNALEAVDLRAHTQKGVSWGIDKTLELGEKVVTRVQESIDYVSEKARPWVDTFRELHKKAVDLQNKIPMPKLPLLPPPPVCWPVPRLPDPAVVVF